MSHGGRFVGGGEVSHSNYASALVIVVSALAAIGLVAVTSATAPLDRSIFDDSIWRAAFGRQGLFLCLAFVAIAVTAAVGKRLMADSISRRRTCIVVFVVSIALLLAVFIPGLSMQIRGSQRWLKIAPAGLGVAFQPSEFAKLALVCFLAYLVTERTADLRDFRRGFLPCALAIAVCAGLVGKEDFGTACLLVAVGFLTLAVGGCRLKHLLLTGMVGLGGLAILLVGTPYRLKRLTSFMDIWSDVRGDGYQPVQSLVTIASGGWLGTGLGAGIQKHGYLPDSHTDFIFSLICEETGVLGGGLIISLFAVFVWLGWQVSCSARSSFERVLAFGLTAAIGLQAAMHIAVVTVVTPTTGISLPLISAGGSGLVICCVMVGVLVAIAQRGAARSDEMMA